MVASWTLSSPGCLHARHHQSTCQQTNGAPTQRLERDTPGRGTGNHARSCEAPGHAVDPAGRFCRRSTSRSKPSTSAANGVTTRGRCRALLPSAATAVSEMSVARVALGPDAVTAYRAAPSHRSGALGRRPDCSPSGPADGRPRRADDRVARAHRRRQRRNRAARGPPSPFMRPPPTSTATTYKAPEAGASRPETPFMGMPFVRERPGAARHDERGVVRCPGAWDRSPFCPDLSRPWTGPAVGPGRLRRRARRCRSRAPRPARRGLRRPPPSTARRGPARTAPRRRRTPGPFRSG